MLYAYSIDRNIKYSPHGIVVTRVRLRWCLDARNSNRINLIYHNGYNYKNANLSKIAFAF